MRRFVAFQIYLILAISASLRSGTASPADRRYNVGDSVPLFVNKVGPLNNPSETYQYYELPFCFPDPVEFERESLGEILNGDRLASTLYRLNFRGEETDEILCHKKLKRDEVARFRHAVVNDYYFQMYYDDLPFWGFVGKTEEESWRLENSGVKYYLFQHVQFDALYNDDRIVEIRSFADPNRVVDITEDVEVDVEFSYSVFWNSTSAPFETRMGRYSRESLLPIHRKIHWFSFINSIAVVMLLVGLLTVLFMRRLKNDLRKFSIEDGEEEKDVSWKYLHGDVFRHPQNLSLFSAVVGTGTQLLTLCCCLFFLVAIGVIYPYNRGVLGTSLVITYTLTSVVAGCSAASFHCQFVETGWGRSVVLVGILYAGPLFVTLSILNIIAVSYGATAALPVGTIFAIILIYILVAMPLLALGGAIGHHYRSEFQSPSAVKRVPREIPPLAWYRKTPCQVFLAGFFSSSAVVLELHFTYMSLWGYKVFIPPSILFAMFAILVLLTAVLSVGLTYIQLSVEDHKWWWRSVWCGGSSALFMFAYCIYFYARSSMSGLLQLSFFLGYNACLYYALFLMLGMISFRASLMFVRHIYHAVKSE